MIDAWTFRISTGAIIHDGVKIGSGYSGFGEAANDPSRVKERSVGPIPPGKYKIGPAYKHASLGPVCMNLDPLPETNTFGRSAFRIHGDNSTPAPHDGSHGCIVLSRRLRDIISKSIGRVLDVTE